MKNIFEKPLSDNLITQEEVDFFKKTIRSNEKIAMVGWNKEKINMHLKLNKRFPRFSLRRINEDVFAIVLKLS